ncbi:general transcription factor 3C polypeptide 3-like [Chenopodium quinoa]|uniref:general transcription factor 3C polypeptide 3-like n=1 Tax=Chenopodium quinoa TaxID=63459 RepID=UPI000B7860FE|nr:general transcription factor 3C polypeptide 3-like [Chenopodium quinoa]XP_021733714.1 general transcription factor 3C polypeptide 3-like [Chenopodium quinoa]
MESEDGMKEDDILEEREVSDGGEEEEEEEEEDVEDDGDGGEDELEEEEECSVRFEGNINPLDFVKEGTSEVQLYQELEKLNYGTLVGKRRQGQGEGSVKKQRTEINAGATPAEMEEVMNYTSRRRSKKPKKRGRRKGSRNKLSTEITKKLGDANLHYAHGRYEEAIRLLREVVLLAPNLPDPYHTLGLVYNSMGDKAKSVNCYMLAANFGPKESPLWKPLVTWSIELGNIGQAWWCLSKAITADPADITLRYHRASLCMEAGDFLKAAESYDQIVQICPDNVEALKNAAVLYKRSGQFERSITLLEDYLNNHPSEADITVVDMLALFFIESNSYTKALQHIEHAKKACGLVNEFPLCLRVREGICHAHLGNIEKAEICFSLLQRNNVEQQMDYMMAVANSYVNLHQHELALKYYLMLDGCVLKNELVSLKIAHCYSALEKATSAIQFFYKGLQASEDDIDARLTLASLLLKENREEEVVELLSPPTNPVFSKDMHADKSEPWWLNVKVKLRLAQIYRTKGKLEAFVEVIYPIIHESLKIDSMDQKAKQRKRLSMNELSERVKVLGDHQTDSVFQNFRRPAPRKELLKANRAAKLLKKRATSKEEKISTAMAAGLDWESDESGDDVPQQPLKEPPLPDLFKDEEHYNLISDLCKALASLRRYSEALELIKLTLKITYKTLPAEKKEKFQSLGAQIALNVFDPSDGFDYVRYIVQQRSQSVAAWNCYYRLVLRLENRLSKHNKFLHHMRVEHKDLVPPMIISGNQFTMISQHQVAAREYLEAHKHMPNSPLTNLCVGTALVNLALGHRLQNKHQCVAQGLAFLYNNLRLCENSQEALYNIARAFHHVGLVTLAATYYERVLAISQEDCPLPELIKVDKGPAKDVKSGYCDLRREAAYNLHLIYKRSGAVDLARQVLRDYCTL